MTTARNSSKIKYFAEEKQWPFFFDDYLFKVVQNLARHVGNRTSTWVFPDAVVKKNKLPTGTVCFSSPEDAILMPHLLRDPGCGYLLFKMEWNSLPEKNWHHKAGVLLEELVNPKSIDPKNKFPLSLSEVLMQGLYALHLSQDEIEYFSNPSFPVNSKISLIAAEELALNKDFLRLTNTIEIRSLLEIQRPEVLEAKNITIENHVGFIHAGCYKFPDILHQRFSKKIADYAFSHHLCTDEDIYLGNFGVPLQSELGMEYFAWLQAASNYAVVNRYYLYQSIKKKLEAAFPCKLSIINDTLHAGVVEKIYHNQSLIYSSRGVQTISTAPNDIRILAGQRESVAALVTNDVETDKYHGMFAHGTTDQFQINYDYTQHFHISDITRYLKLAHNTFYNSIPQIEQCLPHTFNLLSSLNYFSEIHLIKLVALLSPLISIKAEWLKQNI